MLMMGGPCPRAYEFINLVMGVAMICSKSTMIRTAIGLAVVSAVAYVALPAFRTWVVSAWPILLVLICPLSMLFMMGSHGSSNASGKTDKAGRSDAGQNNAP